MRHLFTFVAAKPGEGPVEPESPDPSAYLEEWRVVPGTWSDSEFGNPNIVLLVLHWTALP